MSGIGRGRGWLSVNKNNNQKPIVPNLGKYKLNYDYKTIINTQNVAKYANVLSKIHMFSEHDDQVVVNINLKLIVEEINKACQTSEDVTDLFDVIHVKWSEDEEYGIKVANLMWLFGSTHVHDVKLRALFATHLQYDFENAKQLRISSPNVLRANIKVFGEFCSRGKAGGWRLKFLTQPMFMYMSMLLECTQEADVELFTQQLYLHGSLMKKEQPAQINDIMLQVREQLVRNELCTVRIRLWLLLALDMEACNFQLPPTELYTYYVTQLGEESMNQLKNFRPDKHLSDAGRTLYLDSIQPSGVVKKPTKDRDNSPPPVATTGTAAAAAATVVPNNSSSSIPTSPSAYHEASLTNIGTWEQPKSEKTPRPILGAGVRHTKKSAEERSSDWVDAPEWDNKKWSNDTHKVHKHVSKGWEHDDRFNQDYH